ncbi:MAG: hypothetical protein JXR77_10725, partial [Lentisphaeria bacterium]|nr:hypothetical protein [Lentisphaeria bacterium]
ARNLTREEFGGILRLRPVPGLTMDEVRIDLPGGATGHYQPILRAAPDYASGSRTVVFELASGGRRSLWWRGVSCSLPACIGTRTGVLAGPAGQAVTRRVALVNVGDAAATDVALTLADGSSPVGDLGPGQETTVEVTFTMPPRPDATATPAVRLELDLGDGTVGAGLSSRDIDDGRTESVVRAGRQARRAIPLPPADGARNQMIYFWVDDAVLPPGAYDLEAEVTYFDEGRGSFLIEYDSTHGDSIEDRYRDTARVLLENTQGWRSRALSLSGARLGGRQNGGADLRINGVVPVARIEVRRAVGRPVRRLASHLDVSYRQFGREARQRLRLDLVPLHPGDDPPEVLSPYGGGAVPAGPMPAGSVRRSGDLAVFEGGLTAVFDRGGGGLVSLQEGSRELSAFPGPFCPVLLRAPGGEASYLAPAELEVARDGSLRGTLRTGRSFAGLGGALTIEDRWQGGGTSGHLRLERRIVPSGRLECAEFAAAVLRFRADVFDQVLPLGVGFQADGQPSRGWLETWVSRGWYHLFRGTPDAGLPALAVTVRVEDGAGENTPRRFRYGFFPGADLPQAGPGPRDDELQIQFRGPRELRGRAGAFTLVIDLYAIPNGSYRAAREQALVNLTPERLRRNWQPAAGDWAACGGVQTIVPTAPLYMFEVRQPEWLSEIRGDCR